MGTRWSGLAVLVTLLGGLLVAGAAEAQGELFVADINSITVFGRCAGGNVAPLRILRGEATRLGAPGAPAVDLINNELFVTNEIGNTVTVYSRTASGDTAPLRTIAGDATGLHSPASLAVDLTNNELIVLNKKSGRSR